MTVRSVELELPYLGRGFFLTGGRRTCRGLRDHETARLVRPDVVFVQLAHAVQNVRQATLMLHRA